MAQLPITAAASEARDSGLLEARVRRSAAPAAWLVAYLAAYAAVLARMHRAEGFGLELPLFVLLVMGGGFSALAWLATRGVPPLPQLVRRPAAELGMLAAYLLAVVAFLTWGLEAIHAAFPLEPAKTLAVTAAKLAVFVAGPALLLRVAFGHRWLALAPFGGTARAARAALVMSVSMLAFQALVGRGLADVQRADLRGLPLAAAAAGALVWACLEAGLVEEFFFRALLQSRLAAWLRSETAAVVVMCVLFGLAHAPGFYLRTGRTLEGLGSHPSLLLAAGYSLVVTSAVGFVFGVLWARTGNLWLLVLVHGAADWLQGIVPFAQAWRLR